jgi:hypothetical protein
VNVIASRNSQTMYTSPGLSLLPYLPTDAMFLEGNFFGDRGCRNAVLEALLASQLVNVQGGGLASLAQHFNLAHRRLTLSLMASSTLLLEMDLNDRFDFIVCP